LQRAAGEHVEYGRESLALDKIPSSLRPDDGGLHEIARPRQHPAAEQDFGNVEEAVADIEGKLPGLLRYMDPSDPGMHATDTIDFEVVLEGTVILELDDGAEVTLNPGDTVVQNGTRHRWKNPGDKPARMALFICGANHAKVPAAD